MKKVISFIACCIISIVLVQYRMAYPGIHSGKPLKVTTWDAFGYYVYLPSIGIYKDCTQLKWLHGIDSQYAVTGGNGWQAQKLDNGNYVFKYLGGVAIMETPFFLAGHFIAKHSNYPQDGFSPPYQYSLALGVILYCILAVFLLRKILLIWFTDLTVAITLLLLCLATNFIQYASVDNAMSHAYIFCLYVLILYSTIKWHQKPGSFWALLIGYIIGLATITRPTEAIMLFIPLLWNTHNKQAAKEKWALVRKHKAHIFCVLIGGLLGILPQLIYWKVVTGSFIYDVGSKWEFLSPHFRVLFGWEKGWFIYTPVTIFFIVGMFFIKNFPFRKAVLWFCLLNIYIIIAWHDWRYGASYSTRALVESYPVFALPLATVVEKIRSHRRLQILFYVLWAYLLLVNLFQVTQYESTVLHYNDMNRKYYARIYLNPHPSPVDMSLLDVDEIIDCESNYQKRVLITIDTEAHISFNAGAQGILLQTPIEDKQKGKPEWLKIEGTIKTNIDYWGAYFNADLRHGDSVKHAKVRLFSPISIDTAWNKYAFYIKVPTYFKHNNLKLYISAGNDFDGMIKYIKVTEFEK